MYRNIYIKHTWKKNGDKILLLIFLFSLSLAVTILKKFNKLCGFRAAAAVDERGGVMGWWVAKGV